MSTFGSFYSVKTTYFAFLCFFEKHDFEIKFYNLSVFNFKHLPCVTFWIEKKYNASAFELEILQRVRFWINFCGLVRIWKK